MGVESGDGGDSWSLEPSWESRETLGAWQEHPRVCGAEDRLERAALGPGDQRDLPRQPILGQVDPQVDRVEAALDGSSEKAAGDRATEDACRRVGSREGRRRDGGDDPG